MPGDSGAADVSTDKLQAADALAESSDGAADASLDTSESDAIDAAHGSDAGDDTGTADSGTHPSQMLFWSGFEGPLSLLAAADCYNNGCWQDLVGEDSVTGFQWPPQAWGGNGRFQLLVNGPSANPSMVGDYMRNTIETVTGHKGTPTQALYSEILQSGCCGTNPQGGSSTQDPYLILPDSEPGDVYLSFWRKLQPDLATKLAAGDEWRVLFEFKTAGDFRVSVNIVAWDGATPFWDVRADNVANGGLPFQEYWRDTIKTIPVPVGEWFKFEIYWHRSAGNDGRVWAAINGQVLTDHAGPTMGVNQAPINRIFLSQVYSGSPYPIYQWQDDVQIWSTFPTASAGDAWYDPPYAAQ